MRISPNNRRRHERFPLSPAYTPVVVRPLVCDEPALEGHAYDFSEGGAQFELDRAFPGGTPVAVELVLAREAAEAGTDRRVTALGNIVWSDESEPGPVRMAVAFTRFPCEEDRARLLKHLAGRRLRRAA